ncbi:MAG TPA: AtpZ/AtpI family protein [Stellaceae bacterium]|nr:AtpZ/AtpI family protein [Stellaceae bacterium]
MRAVSAGSSRAGVLLAGRGSMSDDQSSEALARLAERLGKARAQGGDKPAGGDGDNAGQQQALGIGFRIGIEFVVAIIVATGLGWVFDRALGTKPFAVIVMFFLGVATGMLNVYRAITGQGAAVGFRRTKGDGKAKGDRKD